MLHPRFNHLGRSKKKAKKPTKAQAAATAAHRQFLRNHGVDPDRKRIRLRGAIPLDNAAYHRQPNLAPLSNSLRPPLSEDELLEKDLSQ